MTFREALQALFESGEYKLFLPITIALGSLYGTLYGMSYLMNIGIIWNVNAEWHGATRGNAAARSQARCKLKKGYTGIVAKKLYTDIGDKQTTPSRAVYLGNPLDKPESILYNEFKHKLDIEESKWKNTP